MAAYVNASTNVSYGVRTSLSITAPSGQAENNILIATFVVYESTATIAGLTAPASWNLIGDRHIVGGGSDLHWLTYWFRCPSGGQAGSYTFSWTNSRGCAGYISQWNGANTGATPFDATSFSSTVTGGSHTSPSVTSTYDNSRHIVIACDENWGSWTSHAAFTEHVDGSANISSLTASRAISATGATGTYSFTRSAGTAGQVLSLLLMDTTPTGGGGGTAHALEGAAAGDGDATGDLGITRNLASAAAAAGAAAGSLTAVDPRYGRPSADISVGAWTPSTPGDLFPMIDEASASDADYISASTASTCEVRLRGVLDPNSSAGHVIRFRSPAGYTPSGGVVVSLRQGATEIAAWTINPIAANTTYERALDATQANAITDYTDLRLRFEAVN